MRRHVVSSLLCLGLVAGLAGCSASGSVPAGTPTPLAPSASPEHSPAASPTPDLDALYAEAERVVRRATELEEQAIRDGGPEYPAELEELLADPYLTWSRVGVQEYWNLGWTLPDGLTPRLILRPQPGVSQDGSDLALEGCLETPPAVDATGAVVSQGVLLHRSYFLKGVDGGSLRLFTATRGTKVEQCPWS